MSVLSRKSFVTMPCLYQCKELPIGSRLVFSYLMYQHGYHTDPSDLLVHKNTGLSRDKVSEIRMELIKSGWWKDGPTAKFRNFTRPAENDYGYQYFRCYVHQPCQPQTIGSIAIYSFLLGVARMGFQRSLQYKFFADALGFGSNTTPKNCLNALKEGGWLDYAEEGGYLTRFRFYQLGDAQLACLRDKAERDDGPAPTFEFAEETLQPKVASDIIDTTTGGSYAKKDVEKLIDHLAPKLQTFGAEWDREKARLRSKYADLAIPHESYGELYDRLFDCLHNRAYGHVEHTRSQTVLRADPDKAKLENELKQLLQ